MWIAPSKQKQRGFIDLEFQDEKGVKGLRWQNRVRIRRLGPKSIVGTGHHNAWSVVPMLIYCIVPMLIYCMVFPRQCLIFALSCCYILIGSFAVMNRCTAHVIKPPHSAHTWRYIVISGWKFFPYDNSLSRHIGVVWLWNGNVQLFHEPVA